MDFEEEYDDDQSNQKLPAVVSAGTGAAVGVAATSGIAVSAAAGTGGYFAGIGALACALGCETAAIVGLTAVIGVPLLGGALGYGIYRGVKKLSNG
ncbi:MAG: hypothetical protein ACUZ8H_04505 [Candidatus Anammoxibacter sp.]